MPRILEREALLADLAAARTVLASKSEDEDPIGQLAYDERVKLLEQEIARLDRDQDILASVALLFGGDPVHGSRSINADFATVAVGKYQELVSKLYADKVEEKGLPIAGKIPHRALSSLQITDVAHGSFGFVLEEADTDQTSMFDSTMKDTLDEASQLIASFYSDNDEDYYRSVDAVNTRVFSSTRDFFKVLHDSNATLRMVEGSIDEEMDHRKVERAYERSQQTTVEEGPIVVEGILIGIIPSKMEFEFQPDGQLDPIVGKTGPTISRSYLDRIHSQQQVVGSRCQATILVRTTKHPTGKIIRKHTMLNLSIP